MNLLIKNFPDGLAHKLKQQALSEHKSLRDVVIEKLGGECQAKAEKPPKAKSERKRPIAEQALDIYERNNLAQVAEEEMKKAVSGFCEHARDPNTCLECDWVKRNKK